MIDIHDASYAYFWVKFLVSISHFSWIPCFDWVSYPSFLFEFNFSLDSCVMGQCTL